MTYQPPDDPADSATVDPYLRRARGLRRVSAATRWTFTGALAGTAVLGLTYAYLLPGAPTATAAEPVTAAPGDAPGQPPAPDCGQTAVSRIAYRLAENGGSDDEHSEDDDQRGDGEYGERAERQPTLDSPVPTNCAGSGLQPPVQPPVPTRRPARTLTGAS